jgi:hypothetical protein
VDFKDYASIGTSVIALLLSGYSVYYTSFRGADIEVKSGNLLLSSRAKEWQDSLQIFVTIAMDNRGGAAAWVSPLSLQCRSENQGSSLQDFVLHAVYYAKLTDGPWLDIDHYVVPELVTTDKPTVRNVLFSSERGLLAKNQLAAGSYYCDVRAAEQNPNATVHLARFGFSLTENDAMRSARAR